MAYQAALTGVFDSPVVHAAGAQVQVTFQQVQEMLHLAASGCHLLLVSHKVLVGVFVIRHDS